METESNHNRHEVQDVGQAGNVNRVTRIMDLTVAQTRELLYPYTSNAITRPELDDTFKETPIYGIVLSVPDDFSQTTLNLLEQLVHELIVCKAMKDWLSITNPAKADTWAAKADDMEREIRVCLHSRTTSVRRRLLPF